MPARSGNWLHNRYFSIVAYVPAMFMGSLIGLAGFLGVMEISENGMASDLLELPVLTFELYGKLWDYLVLTLAVCSIAMMPATYFLLRGSKGWQPANWAKYAVLGMPVAAIYVVGQITIWGNDLGDVFMELPLGTVGAIILGGAAGGLTYLGIAAISGLSNSREDAAI